MKNRRNKLLIRLVAMCLIVAMTVPVCAGAAALDPVAPCASYYLDSYQAFVYPAGGGKLQVYFDVMGYNYMDDIGALSIKIYESTNNATWTYVDTFFHYEVEGMLGHDDIYHSGHIDYQGVPGKYYRAYVCIWAGKDGGGDSRYLWTSGKLIT